MDVRPVMHFLVALLGGEGVQWSSACGRAGQRSADRTHVNCRFCKETDAFHLMPAPLPPEPKQPALF